MRISLLRPALAQTRVCLQQITKYIGLRSRSRAMTQAEVTRSAGNVPLRFTLYTILAVNINDDQKGKSMDSCYWMSFTLVFCLNFDSGVFLT